MSLTSLDGNLACCKPLPCGRLPEQFTSQRRTAGVLDRLRVVWSCVRRDHVAIPRYAIDLEQEKMLWEQASLGERALCGCRYGFAHDRGLREASGRRETVAGVVASPGILATNFVCMRSPVGKVTRAWDWRRERRTSTQSRAAVPVLQHAHIRYFHRDPNRSHSRRRWKKTTRRLTAGKVSPSFLPTVFLKVMKPQRIRSRAAAEVQALRPLTMLSTNSSSTPFKVPLRETNTSRTFKSRYRRHNVDLGTSSRSQMFVAAAYGCPSRADALSVAEATHDLFTAACSARRARRNGSPGYIHDDETRACQGEAYEMLQYLENGLGESERAGRSDNCTAVVSTFAPSPNTHGTTIHVCALRPLTKTGTRSGR